MRERQADFEDPRLDSSLLKLENRNALLQNAVEKLQKKYDGNVKGNRFRELVPDTKCTIQLSKLPLAAFLRETRRG
jgi:hypothetical protein